MNQYSEITKITILGDNEIKPGSGLLAEHGFSALIEGSGRRILFDTGQGAALEHNASVLGIDLGSLDCIILSHGHYDHTGGLLYAIQCTPMVEVVAHPRALASHLVQRENDPEPREIGIPFPTDSLAAHGARFVPVKNFQQVRPGVWFTGEVPRKHPTDSDPGLYVRKGTELVPDRMEDDASVVIETGSGPVLLLGCAHAGVTNILDHVQDRMGLDTLHAVIGGTHLNASGREETTAFINAIDAFRVMRIAPAHCTGSGPAREIEAHFGPRFSKAFAGAVFEF